MAWRIPFPRWAAAAALILGASSCAYVTRDEALKAWDFDGDGWPDDDDCDPEDPTYHPFAYDLRGDGCDHDCGEEADLDGDDWPDAADCDPEDPTKHPCSPYESDGDNDDFDCDGLDGVRSDPCPGLDPDFPDVEAGSDQVPICDLPPEGG